MKGSLGCARDFVLRLRSGQALRLLLRSRPQGLNFVKCRFLAALGMTID